MKVYYNYSKSEIMTEEEAREYAEERVNEMSYTDMLTLFPTHVLWDMLSDDIRSKIIEELIENIYDEEFTVREIEEEENGSI